MKIEDYQKKVIAHCKNEDPFTDSFSWSLIEKYVPSGLWGLLLERDGFVRLIKLLPEVFPSQLLVDDDCARECWVRIGNYFKNQHLYGPAITLYHSLYDSLLNAQLSTGVRILKGTPLVWLSDCYNQLNHRQTSLRYLMLALIENAIHNKGNIPPETTGTYWRLLYPSTLTHDEICFYANQAYRLHTQKPEKSRFPEYVLQSFDTDWQRLVPSIHEAKTYHANKVYLNWLISKLGDTSGKTLERLADYMLACVPGFRTSMRKITQQTDYDLVCTVEGINIDFRSDLGRYFVCKCKDWNEAVSFSVFAKFCRVLDSVKAKFGILFSKNGISGRGKKRFADLEQIKVYQDRGLVIVVIDKEDINSVCSGTNFLSLLQKRYEAVRLGTKDES